MARVMVVDDSLMMRRNLTTLLQNTGHEVVAEAKNGLLALTNYPNVLPDLVTMDVTMPIMDGITAARKILNHYPEAIIIMISAQNQQSMIYDALKSGAKNYILKPIRTDKLKAVIDEALLSHEVDHDHDPDHDDDQDYEHY